ncbi:apolipoprotein C-IV [Nothobranchius furzeri]|uniref:Zgc:193682 n=2 Tax=Nothobranchius furzeri TaxID=105023 RepID=A0A1A8UP39_NOTFU|nr:apolipoprotein C-IV [Nothobranchius furzeri]
MMHVQAVFVLLLLLQACEPAAAQTPDPAEAPGILQRISEKIGETRAKIWSLGEAMVEFVGTYYEDHIQPKTESYAEWASNMRSSLRQKIWSPLDD